MSIAKYRVDVSETVSSGETLLKIVWNYNDVPDEAYFIRAQVMKAEAENVRKALQLLVDKGMSDKGQLGPCGKELRELAKAGQSLHKALFQQKEGVDAGEIAAWLRDHASDQKAQGNRCQVTFVVDCLVHIPWGLIYDGPIENSSEDASQDSIEDYEDFWCLKFLTCAYYRRVRASWVRASISSKLGGVFSVHHKSAFDKAVTALVKPQDRVWEWVQEHFGSPFYSSKDFFEQWQDRGRQCRLLYFYCHAVASELSLGINDLISSSKFRGNTSLPTTQQSTCLVFLNGCNTAVGDPGGAFLIATGEFLFCGFVGTETKVPDVFALRFGLAFLYCFLHEGYSVSDTLDYLRRKHWPLGLIYAAYCEPSLTFTPIDQSLQIQMDDNFSCMILGTEEM